ncbi:uncharacterized protein (DUF849 family) [Kribbella amoyensis]|uniref:Uncharacterized protein (DUF849 family) n=1 Tax=Kribbella amoyensis TaxID=996641 RepID=A0A561BUG6_9ACTN|nr:3-keto-5-aminohexanoate cleavage protein [Kribbella amoyensis]TWD82433.1 uncharacterized protein (DUF849 family) [Kribbella amoyensis]
MGRVLKVCLNGDRRRADHAAVPITPVELADDAFAAVAAGAQVIHLHPRGADERESLRWDDVRAAVAAVRTRCPGFPVGVSTREEIVSALADRLALLTDWRGPDDDGPDFASVNWHEDGAEQVAEALLGRGIGIEAGLFTPASARKFRAWAGPVVRVLVEALPGISPGTDGVTAARDILAEVDTVHELVVHGENEWTWDVLDWARTEGYGLRVGLEDVLTAPGGATVTGNAELVELMRGQR